MSTEDVMARLKGPKGTKVHVKVVRRGVNELLPFTIVRDKIPVYSLDASNIAAPKIGYIKIQIKSRPITASIAQSEACLGTTKIVQSLLCQIV